VFTGPPQVYTVICMAVVDNAPIILKTVVTITGQTPPPNPGPTPNPGPGPPTPGPVPISGRVWAIGIFATSDQTKLSPGQLELYGGPDSFKRAVKDAGAIWRRYEPDDLVPLKAGGTGPVSGTKWGQAAISVGLPALVMIDETGKVVASMKLPPDSAGVVAAVKGALGK
jgi:hypothetical protein